VDGLPGWPAGRVRYRSKRKEWCTSVSLMYQLDQKVISVVKSCLPDTIEMDTGRFAGPSARPVCRPACLRAQHAHGVLTMG
jgi:hypothetical protein